MVRFVIALKEKNYVGGGGGGSSISVFLWRLLSSMKATRMIKTIMIAIMAASVISEEESPKGGDAEPVG